MRLIDADALKENAREWLPEIVANKNPFVVMGLFDLIDNLADNMPTIDPVKHGKWKNKVALDENLEPTIAYRHRCSACQFEIYTTDESLWWNYCPNCGAEMT